MKVIFTVFIFLVLLVGCSRTEEFPLKETVTSPVISIFTPTPTLIPTSTPTSIPTKVVVDERVGVIESLTLFNNTDNNFMQFMESNKTIYQLSGNPYHVTFVAWTQISLGLIVYNDAITNWTPPLDNTYYSRLIKIKEAELYRIQTYRKLTEEMLMSISLQNDVVIEGTHNKFLAWKNDPINREPVRLQSKFLKELNINHDDVNFLYGVSIEKPGEGFNNLLVPNSQGL